jgi:hypothetical protein
MSLVDKTTPKLVVPSDLQLFKGIPTDMTIQDIEEIPYRPIALFQPDEGDIDFHVPGNAEDYIKLTGTAFTADLQIQRADGTDLAENEQVGPENLPGHTIIGGLRVQLGNQVVCDDMRYPFTAHAQIQLSFGGDAKDSHLTSALYAKDTAGNMNAYYTPPSSDEYREAITALVTAWHVAHPGPNNPTNMQLASSAARAIAYAEQTMQSSLNMGLQKRAAYFANSRLVPIRIILAADIFNIGKYLPSGIDLKIKLIRSRPEFALHAVSPVNNEPRAYKINILNPTLWVQKAKIFPPVFVGQNRNLEIKDAKFNITRRVTKPITIPIGTTSFTMDNVTVGQVPKRIIYGFISNAAYNGSYAENPFNYRHLNLTQTALYVNGKGYPLTPYKPTYTGDNPNYQREYASIFNALGIYHGNRGIDINRDDYPNGYCLYAYDLTPNRSAGLASPVTLKKDGNTRIEFQLSVATEQSYICMIFMEFDNMIRIDGNRNVFVDYTL